MNINQTAHVDTTCLSTAACADRVQGEVQVKMLKKTMDFEQEMMAKLLQSMEIGQQIDTVA